VKLTDPGYNPNGTQENGIAVSVIGGGIQILCCSIPADTTFNAIVMRFSEEINFSYWFTTPTNRPAYVIGGMDF
jgi:hypothetical protein